MSHVIPHVAAALESVRGERDERLHDPSVGPDRLGVTPTETADLGTATGGA